VLKSVFNHLLKEKSDIFNETIFQIAMYVGKSAIIEVALWKMNLPKFAEGGIKKSPVQRSCLHLLKKMREDGINDDLFAILKAMIYFPQETFRFLKEFRSELLENPNVAMIYLRATSDYDYELWEFPKSTLDSFLGQVRKEEPYGIFTKNINQIKDHIWEREFSKSKLDSFLGQVEKEVEKVKED
jgi:hypothetical protein